MSRLFKIKFILSIYLLTACHYKSNEYSLQQNLNIQLEQLNKQTTHNDFEQFFQERGASRIWKELQTSAENLFISFTIVEPSNSPEQINEVCAGIIKYLINYNPTIKRLELIGSPEDIKKKINRLPTYINQLQHLIHLSFAYNHLSELPEQIAELQKLERIELTNNTFQEFPITLCKLKNLKMLSCNENSITIIPPAISQLTNLIRLNLSNNQLSVLPFSLSDLNSAKVFNGNPWLSPDLCIQLTTNSFTNGIDSYHYNQIKARLRKHPTFIGISSKIFSKQIQTLVPSIQAYQAMIANRIIYFQEVNNELIPFYWQQESPSKQTIEEEINKSFSNKKVYLIPLRSQQDTAIDGHVPSNWN